DREAEMVERAAAARLRLVVAQEDQPRVAQHQAVRRFGRRLAAERLPVPLHRLRLIRHVQVDVIDDRENLRWLRRQDVAEENDRRRGGARAGGRPLDDSHETHPSGRIPYQTAASGGLRTRAASACDLTVGHCTNDKTPRYTPGWRTHVETEAILVA